MHQALASTLSLSLYILASIPTPTSASILLPLPSPNTSTSTTTPLSLLPPTNLTLPSNGMIRCVIPHLYPIAPINIPTCQPTLDRLISYPWSNTRYTYTFPPGRPMEVQSIKISDGVCAIRLDRRVPKGSITISLREIVGIVIRVLTACVRFGEGGWLVLDPPWEGWIVVVEGGGRGVGGVGGGVMRGGEGQ